MSINIFLPLTTIAVFSFCQKLRNRQKSQFCYLEKGVSNFIGADRALCYKLLCPMKKSSKAYSGWAEATQPSLAWAWAELGNIKPPITIVVRCLG